MKKGGKEMADDKDKGEFKYEVENPQCTSMVGPQEFRVLDETEEYYIIKKEGGTVGAVEKSKVIVVVISGYIT